MNETIRKWLMTIGILVLGFGLLWTNQNVASTNRIKEDSIEACERNRSDRMIQREGWRAAETARRISAARADTQEQRDAELAAAATYRLLQERLEPLINIDCVREYTR